MKLNEFLDHEQEVNTDRFKVDDEQKANWALRKIADLKSEMESNVKLAEKEIEKIKEWETSQNNQLQDSILYFEGLLNEYAISLRANNKEFKSLSLPNGRIGFRNRPVKWQYNDSQVLEHLESAGLSDYINVKKTVNKRDLKANFEVAGDKVINPETGEVIEGIRLVEQEESFNVRSD